MVGEIDRDGLVRATHRLIEEGVESPALLALSVADSDGEADLEAPIGAPDERDRARGLGRAAGRASSSRSTRPPRSSATSAIRSTARAGSSRCPANPQFRELVTRWEANEGDHDEIEADIRRAAVDLFGEEEA